MQIKNLEKRFGETLVLKDINLDIKKGEFLTLVGESGSGKSTLLRIIAGLEEKSSGELLLNGEDLSKKAPKDRDLAMVFQSYALYPHLTVAQNLATPLLNRGKAIYKLPFATKFLKEAKEWKKDIDKEVEKVAQKLQISHLLERKPKALSGGQNQRVALGRAMIRKPIAFLMDEPLSNLDAKLRVHMRNELTELHRELGITFIYVTHDQVEAMSMSSRIAFLVDGNLLQTDTPDNMYNNPNHLKVAEFIGTPKINTLTCSIQNNIVIFDKQILQNLPKNELYTFAIRSEYIDILSDSPYKVKVQNKENMGNEFLVHVNTMFAKSNFTLKVSADYGKSIKIGDILPIGFREDKALYFNSEGKRVFSGIFHKLQDEFSSNRQAS